MSKYNRLKILKRRRARFDYECQNCGSLIKVSDFYYSLELSGRINYPGFRRKTFCENCYKKNGEKLLLRH